MTKEKIINYYWKIMIYYKIIAKMPFLIKSR